MTIQVPHVPRQSAVLRRLAMLAALLSLSTAAVYGEEVSKEYQIKAAFVYNFTKFISWPAQSFAAADSPIVIGVLCQTAIAAELETTVKNRKVNGRAIAVLRMNGPEQAGSTNLVFVCASEDAQFATVRKAIANSPVLTVGESASFAQQGGMINFVLEGDKVRFEINADSAENAGLKISAQLQKLALSVRRGP